MRRLAGFVALSLLCVSARASENVYQSSVSAGRWLDLPFSTQAAGLAGLGATGQGVDALSYNPAGLANVDEFEADLGQDYWLTDASSQRLGFAMPVGPGGLGVAFDNVDFGTVDQYSVNSLGAVAQGSVNPDAWALQAAYGLSLGSLSLGAAAQGLSQNLISQEQIGYDLDLGAAYEVGPLRVGLALLGAVGELGGEDLPRTVNLEGRYHAWSLGASSIDLLASGGWSVSDSEASGAVALEATVNRYFTVRGGYRAAGNNTAAGWAAGLSARPLPWLGLDYTYNAVGSLQATNQWTLNLYWGAWQRASDAEAADVIPTEPKPAPSPVPTPVPRPALVPAAPSLIKPTQAPLSVLAPVSATPAVPASMTPSASTAMPLALTTVSAVAPAATAATTALPPVAPTPLSAPAALSVTTFISAPLPTFTPGPLP